MSEQSAKSRDEWMIHALNIHGLFLEAWCRNAVESSPQWRLVYHNYPVEWPQRTGMMRGDETELDLRADTQHGTHLISLLIECKKNNPELTEWVFFPKRSGWSPSRSRVYSLNLVPDAGNRWSVTSQFNELIWVSAEVEDARETKGKYPGSDSTRTSNAAITSAARQVCTAYRAIAHEETTIGRDRLPVAKPSYRQHFFVPVIVTNAHLHLCQFHPADVDAETGEIPISKATLEPVRHVRFEYPLPPSLQWKPLEGEMPDMTTAAWREPYIRQRILIINAASFPRLLGALQHQTTLNDF